MKFLKVVLVICMLFGIRDLWVRRSRQAAPAALELEKLHYVHGSAPKAGQPLLLEFWATWCPPCRDSIPHLNGVYGKYSSQGLSVVGLTSETADKVESFLKQVPMNYTVGIDSESALARHYGVAGIPHAFLFDAKQKLIWHGHPMQLDEAILQKVLPTK